MVSPLDNSPSPLRYPDDLELAEAALEGDKTAWDAVRGLVQSAELKQRLVARGASLSEAEDIQGDLLADCFQGQKAKGGVHRILGKYNGGCTLKSFLHLVAMHRLISLKRKQKRMLSLDADAEEHGADRPLPGGDVQPGPDAWAGEDAVVDVLRSALLKALPSVDQEKLVLLRLIYSYRVPQKKIAMMWGWSDAKVCRQMATLLDELRNAVLSAVKEQDSWLRVEWEDFLNLCRESNDLFDYHVK